MMYSALKKILKTNIIDLYRVKKKVIQKMIYNTYIVPSQSEDAKKDAKKIHEYSFHVRGLTPVSVLKKAYFVLQTDKDVKNPYAIMETIAIMQESKTIYQFTGEQLGVFWMLQGVHPRVDKNTNTYYFPLPIKGLQHPYNCDIVFEQTENAIKVNAEYKMLLLWEDEPEALRTNTAPKVENNYWKVGPVQSIPLNAKQDETISIPVNKNIQGPCEIAQLVWYVVSPNQQTSWWYHLTETTITENETPLFKMDSYYHSVAMDKDLHNLPIPSNVVMTQTFDNWQKQTPNEAIHTYSSSDKQQLVMKIQVKKNLPEDSVVRFFCIVSS